MLHHVQAATLLLEESDDPWVLERERRASESLAAPCALQLVRAAVGCGSAVEEEIAGAAIAWFRHHFARPADRVPLRDDVVAAIGCSGPRA
jgi:hypothetical protein